MLLYRIDRYPYDLMLIESIVSYISITSALSNLSIFEPTNSPIFETCNSNLGCDHQVVYERKSSYIPV
jgi:hypothetical protein